MLAPFRQLYPTRLTAPAQVQNFVIEQNLPVSPILQPKIFFRNISTDPAQVTITHVLDLGVSDDPMLSGNWPTVIVEETVGPGELLWHEFPSVFLSSDGMVYHEISLEIAGAIDDVILEIWVEGVFEESLKKAPCFEPITI